MTYVLEMFKYAPGSSLVRRKIGVVSFEVADDTAATASAKARLAEVARCDVVRLVKEVWWSDVDARDS